MLGRLTASSSSSSSKRQLLKILTSSSPSVSPSRVAPSIVEATTTTTAATTTTMTTKRWHGGPHVGDDAPVISVTFLQPDDTKKTVDAKVGETFLQIAHRHEIDLEGACEGVCACSTCHLIMPVDVFDDLPEASEDEEDMLDMAFGLTETSRLGCQVTLTKEMDGIVVEMPKATRNFYVDGHVPKPH